MLLKNSHRPDYCRRHLYFIKKVIILDVSLYRRWSCTIPAGMIILDVTSNSHQPEYSRQHLYFVWKIKLNNSYRSDYSRQLYLIWMMNMKISHRAFWFSIKDKFENFPRAWFSQTFLSFVQKWYWNIHPGLIIPGDIFI